MAETPKVNGAAVDAGMSSFDFSDPSREDPLPNPNDGAATGAADGLVPNVNADPDEAAVLAPNPTFRKRTETAKQNPSEAMAQARSLSFPPSWRPAPSSGALGSA